MNTAILERRIEFQGCSNFRDLGGYRTSNGGVLRWGRLFRSDGIHPMTRSDADKARRELRITTVLDLRTVEERSPWHGPVTVVANDLPPFSLTERYGSCPKVAPLVSISGHVQSLLQDAYGRCSNDRCRDQGAGQAGDLPGGFPLYGWKGPDWCAGRSAAERPRG